MSAAPDTLNSLVSAVGARLWRQSAVDAAAQGMRIGAAVLLGGGAYHLFAHAVPTAIPVTLALVPVAGAFLMVLWRRRPSAAIAAHTADAWFDGKNLITSAWELRQRPGATSATSELVVARAQTAAAQWHPRLAAEHPLRRPRALAVALLLALTGIFLLQLPSKEWLAPLISPHAQSPRPDAPAARRDDSALQRAPDVTAVRQQTGAVETRARAAATPSSVDQPPQSSAQPGTTGGAVSPDVANALPPPGTTRPATASVAANDGGKQAGDQGGIRANRDINLKAVPLQISEAGMQRTAGTQGITRNGDELGNASATPAHTPRDVTDVPAARHTRTVYSADYSPSLRAYMARYFSQHKQPAAQP